MEETFHSLCPGCTPGAGESSVYTKCRRARHPGFVECSLGSHQPCSLFFETRQPVQSLLPCVVVSSRGSFLFPTSHYIQALDYVFVFGCFSAASWISVSNPVLQIAWLGFVFVVFLWNCDSQRTPFKQSPLSPWDSKACFENKSQNRRPTRVFTQHARTVKYN